MIEIDSISMLVDVKADCSVAELEEQLQAEGYTFNYFPLSGKETLLLDALTRRLPNLYGEAFGGIEELCLQGRWSQSDGELYFNVRSPRSATGPSLKKMAIGSENWLGVPVQACFRIFPKPSQREIAALAFPSEAGREAFEKALRRSGARFPLRARVGGDDVESFVAEVKAEEACLVLSWWGNSTQVEIQRDLLTAAFDSKKGRRLEQAEEVEEGDYFSWLRAKAAEALQARIDAALKSLPPSHRDLAAFLAD